MLYRKVKLSPFLQLEKETGGSGSCSSSADSTPQKRPSLPPKPTLAMPSTSFQQKSFDLKLRNIPAPTTPTCSSSHNNNNSPDPCRFSELPPQPKRPSRLCSQPAPKKPISSRFFGFESESCSSAVSSLDSVCSGSSDGIPNSSRSNSDLSSMNSSSLVPGRTQIPPKTLMAKFQVRHIFIEIEPLNQAEANAIELLTP